MPPPHTVLPVHKDGPGTSLDANYNYDLRGLNVSSRFGLVKDQGQGITNDFDGFGRLKSSTNSMFTTPRTLTYSYDDNSNRSTLTHPDAQVFTYGFDNLDRVKSVAEGASAIMLCVNYNDRGRRDTLDRKSVCDTSPSTGAITQYAYDNGGRIKTFTQDLKDSATNYDLTNSFTYNYASQVTSLTVGNDLYYYRGNDNKTGAYIPNGLNQYDYINGQPIGYDTNGNLTTGKVNNEVNPWTYTYDNENHLLTANGGGVSSTLRYDPLGRLFEYYNGSIRQFLWDGDALVAEYDSSGTMTNRYVHGDQVDEPWVEYSSAAIGAANRRFYHTDHQGSIIAQSNNSGFRLYNNGYDQFGIAANTNQGRFGYTGQLSLKEIGLNYYKARIYWPIGGRFLQTDPIGYKDDMDLYAYVGNDPVNRNDPSGLACKALAVGIGYTCDYTDDQSSAKKGDAISAAAVGNSVRYKYKDGSTETRSGGSRSWRNNNPGNLRDGGDKAVGKAGGFAVFGSHKAGGEAMIKNLKTEKYQEKTVGKAISTWAPIDDGNNPAHYAEVVSKITGLKADTKMDSLNDSQLTSVGNAIERFEGWKSGTVSSETEKE